MSSFLPEGSCPRVYYFISGFTNIFLILSFECISPLFSFGRYISKRKTEALASARAKELDPTCPLGHVVMPDDERRETLDMVLKSMFYSECVYYHYGLVACSYIFLMPCSRLQPPYS